MSKPKLMILGAFFGHLLYRWIGAGWINAAERMWGSIRSRKGFPFPNLFDVPKWSGCFVTSAELILIG